MNNTIGMNGRVRTAASKAKKAPAWLVMIAHIILWFTKEETKIVFKAGTALVIVIITAMFAGGISCGALPLGYGVVICAALLSIAMLLTRDFV